MAAFLLLLLLLLRFSGGVCFSEALISISSLYSYTYILYLYYHYNSISQPIRGCSVSLCHAVQHHQHRSTILSHIILQAPPKKTLPYTLLHFVGAVILFLCVRDCICSPAPKSSTHPHSHAHILEIHAQPIWMPRCCSLTSFYSFFIVAILLYENTMAYCAHKNKVLGELLDICFEI